MIIYPSESYVADQKCLEKKLNTYFELATQQQSASKESIFADDGVPVFVSEADTAETYYYTVLPLIDFVCFEVFNQTTDTKDKPLNLKPIIKQWTNYVQAVRSHTSLYPTQCKWQKHNLDMNENQLALYNELESLLLTDDLKELDDIIRVSCGAPVNANSGDVTEFQLASKLAHNFSQLAKASNMLKQGENCAIEKAALEVKCEKLNADVTAIENIAAENKAQLQHLQKEAESLRENNLSQAQKLESALSDRQQSEEKLNQQLQQVEQELAKALSEKVEAEANFEKQIQAQEQKLAEVLKEKEESITELKQEGDLAQLQIVQLQEELERLFSEKNRVEANFEKQKEDQEQKLAEALKKKDESIAELKQENELSQLQISQLQEELEFYFEKANSLQVNDAPLINATSENSVTSVAKHASENHNTLNLINRLMTEQGREK